MQPLQRLVITPTNRLARQIGRERALAAAARGERSWQPEAVLTFPAWIAQLRDDALLLSQDPRVPIDAQQAMLLWESIIDHDVFVGEPEVAGLAQRAQRTIVDHQLNPPERWPELLLSEDSRRFKSWAWKYARRCGDLELIDEWTFAAELPARIQSGEVATPLEIELVGFELPLTPLQQSILDAAQAQGTVVQAATPTSAAAVLNEIGAYADAGAEIIAAAEWARSIIDERSDAAVAIVVPNLAGRVGQVERALREAFDAPGARFYEMAPSPWHISLGRPLPQWPLVADALTVLGLDIDRVTQPEASSLLRSPFLTGADAEALARARALATLHQRAPYDLTPNELQWALTLEASTALSEAISVWLQLRRNSARSAWPSEWAGVFQRELASLGFGSGRALNSVEAQVLQRWHALLESFGTLDAVAPERYSRSQALDALRERAAATVFRERNVGVPVEVLGVEEALGSRFDAVWITGLDSDTWPGPTQRDPLIPLPIQATVARATSDGCLARAEQELNGLLRCAPTAIGSFVTGKEEPLAQPTTVLGMLTIANRSERPEPTRAEMDAAFTDAQAPPFPGGQAPGGTAVLRNQSRCPFRAFAEQRLGARDITPPRPGLSAGQRGDILHRALEAFWAGLVDRAALEALSTEARDQRVEAATQQALNATLERYRLLLPPAARRIEQQRAASILHRWLDVELKRDDFAVLNRELKVHLDIAGLNLAGYIDRIDRLADGTLALIDYKTGQTDRKEWYPEARIADPQLPAYAIAMDPQPGVITFARLRADDISFNGLSAEEAGMEGVLPLERARGKFGEVSSWQDLLTQWRQHLETLASDFMSGNAAVNPRDTQACKYCHLHALCRVHERSALGQHMDDDTQDVTDE